MPSNAMRIIFGPFRSVPEANLGRTINMRVPPSIRVLVGETRLVFLGRRRRQVRSEVLTERDRVSHRPFFRGRRRRRRARAPQSS